MQLNKIKEAGIDDVITVEIGKTEIDGKLYDLAEELPEIEKAYDRNTAVDTLKLICELGFKITKE